MAFRDLTPTVGLVTPDVKLSSRVLGSGDVTVSLSISDRLYEKLDRKKRDKVRVSWDDDAHQLRVQADGAGPFKWATFKKGGARIILPKLWDDQDDMDATPLKLVGEPESDGFTVQLPATWFEPEPVRNPSRPGTSTPIRSPTTSVSTGPAIINGKLDLVDYLAKKNYKISRLAEGRFQINGEVLIKRDVLAIVNKLRANANLPILLDGDVA